MKFAGGPTSGVARLEILRGHTFFGGGADTFSKKLPLMYQQSQFHPNIILKENISVIFEKF